MKNNLIKSIVSLFISVLAMDVNAGSVICPESINSKVLVSDSAEGTYQIQMVNTRGIPSLPANLNQLVEENRKENTVSFYNISDKVRIKILSIQTITNPNFVPIPPEERVIYVTD